MKTIITLLAAAVMATAAQAAHADKLAHCTDTADIAVQMKNRMDAGQSLADLLAAASKSVQGEEMERFAHLAAIVYDKGRLMDVDRLRDDTLAGCLQSGGL